MEKYVNRSAAGKILAQYLSDYKNQSDTYVLALPRGGVPVAYEVAQQLQLPLDVFIVRKLGAPGHAELAMGAITLGNTHVFNEDIIRDLQITQHEIQLAIAKEELELARREKIYRGERPFPSLENKTIILVDDGIATGATMRAAITALRNLNVKEIIVAVPVAARDTCSELQLLADAVICPLQPTQFFAVGAWYDDFTQTEDDEVGRLLAL